MCRAREAELHALSSVCSSVCLSVWKTDFGKKQEKDYDAEVQLVSFSQHSHYYRGRREENIALAYSSILFFLFLCIMFMHSVCVFEGADREREDRKHRKYEAVMMEW